MTPKFHTLTIADVRRETPDAVSIAFDVPDDLADAYRYRPGQYVTLKTGIDGEEVRRSYSICAGLDDGELRIAVKRIAGGVFSAYANEALAPGIALDVMTPMGRFVLPEAAPGKGRIIAAFAAGSGITPVMAHLETILRREPQSRFFLFYGNQTAGSILFRDAIDDLKDRHMQRLSVYHVLSREQQDVSLLSGRIDAGKVATFMRHVVPFAAVDHALLCGPGGLIDQTRQTLTKLGMPAEKVHAELFSPADGSGQDRRRSRPVEAAAIEPPAATVAMTLDGVTREFGALAGETIIDAATRQGIDAPFSCKGGMCCTCRAKVIEGAVEMKVNYSLQPWELEAGFVLTCQSVPTTPTVQVDYDSA
jgi:ring-1,2-phenylacetyl-CoA epoxidase subunit PaaE